MKLEIIEGCFGPDVRIDDDSLFKHEYDQRTDEDVDNLQQKLIDEISKIKFNLDMGDWAQIAQILANRSNLFQMVEGESSEYSCDQCGNYNWRYVYIKSDDDNEVNDTKES